MKKSLSILAVIVTFWACNNTDNNAQQTVNSNASANEISIYDKKWKLLTINGEPLTADSTLNKVPELNFKKDSLYYWGKGGCNGYGGTYELTANKGILFSDMAATEMACANLQVEEHFFDALRNATSYRINHDTLLLYRNDNIAIAAFKGANKDGR